MLTTEFDLLKKTIESRLASYVVPYLEKDLKSIHAMPKILISNDTIEIDLTLPFPTKLLNDQIVHDLQALIAEQQQKVKIHIRNVIDAHVGNKSLKGYPTIKNMIAVASGKGGVGKSTVAVNLALALSQAGASVGLLDADIYGPSQPKMLGVETVKPQVENKKIHPVKSHGIQTMSIGFLVDINSAMIWRGPMVSMALQQLLNDTLWDPIDYLIIDLPPGTGDIQLTLAQKIPVSAAVVVTTPQDLALLDARRAFEMFKKVSIPVLGIIENMSLHTCSQCGHTEAVFGQGGGSLLAKTCDLPLLGQLPLDSRIRSQTDAGSPPVITPGQEDLATLYQQIALKIAAKLVLQPKDYSNKFPNITVAE